MEQTALEGLTQFWTFLENANRHDEGSMHMYVSHIRSNLT